MSSNFNESARIENCDSGSSPGGQTARKLVRAGTIRHRLTDEFSADKPL